MNISFISLISLISFNKFKISKYLCHWQLKKYMSGTRFVWTHSGFQKVTSFSILSYKGNYKKEKNELLKMKILYSVGLYSIISLAHTNKYKNNKWIGSCHGLSTTGS